MDKGLVILSIYKQTQALSAKETKAECKLCPLDGMAITYVQ